VQGFLRNIFKKMDLLKRRSKIKFGKAHSYRIKIIREALNKPAILTNSHVSDNKIFTWRSETFFKALF